MWRVKFSGVIEAALIRQMFLHVRAGLIKNQLIYESKEYCINVFEGKNSPTFFVFGNKIVNDLVS